MHWVAHLAAYALIAFAFGLGWSQRSTLSIWVFVAAIGAIHEITEIITHSHAFETEDAVVNAIGALIGVAILRVIVRLTRRCIRTSLETKQLSRPLGKTLTIITLIAMVIGVLVGAKSLLLPTQHLPYLDIEVPGGLRVHFLQKGLARSTQCARTLESQISALKGSCPSCRIETSGCRTDIEGFEKQWLGEEPISTPSARMPYGVIIFEAPQQEVALAACQKSEKQSIANIPTGRIRCFPAGVKRPLLNIEQNILEQERSERRNSIEIASASLLGLIAIAVASLALVRRFAVKEPLEHGSIETVADQIGAFKLSNVIKRAVDILLAATLLIALLPIFVLIAVLIRILEGAPIFYISRRFISADKIVTIFKFRTMVKDATSPKYRLKERFMRDGYLDIPLACEVYTPIGRLLERAQLVETLQLLNIIFDGMSFVGNRPLPKDNIELLKKFPGWQERFDSPAGITGISQITGKYGLLPQQRLYLERIYASVYRNPEGNIVLCDLYITSYTVFLLLTQRYLEYGKAVEFLIRCGGDKDLSSHDPLEAEIQVSTLAE